LLQDRLAGLDAAEAYRFAGDASVPISAATATSFKGSMDTSSMAVLGFYAADEKIA
jgi:hypothetical protein